MKLHTLNDIRASIHATHKAGKARGKSTGWAKIDELWTLGEGNLIIVTGIPSSGKSEWIDQLAMHRAALHNQHTTFFSPENWPLEAHAQKFAEKYVGKPMWSHGATPAITPKELDEAIDFTSKYFTFLEPSDKELNVDSLLDGLLQSEELNTTQMFVLDPWNELENNPNKNISVTHHISESLSKIRNFGRRHKIDMVVVAHPTKLKKNEDTGNYPVPTPYDISDSANWRNKTDVCISVWRDYALNDGCVDIHVQKMRNKNFGTLGTAQLHWLYSNGIFTDIKVDVSAGEQYAIRGRMGMKNILHRRLLHGVSRGLQGGVARAGQG